MLELVSARHRHSLTWLARASLVLLAIWPAPALSAPPSVTAKIIPCAGPCALMQWDSISVQGAASDGQAFSVPTSMTQINTVVENAAGNIVVVGRIENGIPDIEVIDPARKQSLAEFWTTNFGISADSRLIAFTEFFAPHLEASLYDGALVYLFDAARQDIPPERLTRAPSTAVPVFPPYFVEAGRKYVLLLPKSKLYLVESTDLKWLSPSSFMFVATVPGRPKTVTPITLNAPGGDWKNVTFEAGQALDCSQREEPLSGVDSFLTNCKPAK